MPAGKRLNELLARISPLERAAQWVDRQIPQDDPADVLNELERGGSVGTYRARQLDAAMNLLPEPIRDAAPVELQGGPASGVWNAAVRIANWANARNPAKQETPRQRAERQYGEGIEARIRRSQTPQPRKFK